MVGEIKFIHSEQPPVQQRGIPWCIFKEAIHFAPFADSVIANDYPRKKRKVQGNCIGDYFYFNQVSIPITIFSVHMFSITYLPVRMYECKIPRVK